MSEQKYTKTYLAQLQALPLSEKILITQNRIIEFYKHYLGQVYVSFSGGKDSTVVLDIARQIYPNLLAVFSDTGLEYPEIKDFVKTKDNVTIIHPEMNFKQVIETYGYPILSKELANAIDVARRNPDGKTAAKFNIGNDHDKKYPKFSITRWEPLKNSDIPISAKCCEIMKKNPMHKFNIENNLHPITGQMASESRLRMNQWLKNGCNVYDARNPVCNPISFWTDQDVLQYIKENNLSYASIYGDIEIDKYGKYYTTGCYRTGCVYCLFGAHLESYQKSRLRLLQKTHPKLYDYCLRSKEEGGLGMKKIIDDFNEKYATERTHIFY